MDSCTFTTPVIVALFAATTAFFSAIATAIFAYQQLKTNKQKLNLDLYNRRFSVYENSLAYYKKCHSENNKENIVETADKFITSYRESIFLFGKDSDIYNLLTKLKDTLDRLGANRTDENLADLMSQSQEIMKQLEEKMLPWLNFKNIKI